MSEKLYHKQPCFCLPCKMVRAETEKSTKPDKPKQKAKKSVE